LHLRVVRLPEKEHVRYCHDYLGLRFMQHVQHLTLRINIIYVGTIELRSHIPFYILPLLDISKWSVTKLSTWLPEIYISGKGTFVLLLAGHYQFQFGGFHM
jgi:hypothetical protein